MLNHTQNPAENSPLIKLHLKLLESRFRAVKGSLEMLTVFQHPNIKSAECMIEDAALLLDAACELHSVMSKSEVEYTFDQASSPCVDLYDFLSETSEEVLNNNQHQHQITSKQPKSNDKSGIESTFVEALQLVGERLGRKQVLDAMKDLFCYTDLINLQKIKTTKAYKGLKVVIEGNLTTINTFEDYCQHVEGKTRRSIDYNLDNLEGLGIELFTVLKESGIGIREMRTCCKLPAEQKQALLKIARTGDKAATLAFIQQAFSAGE